MARALLVAVLASLTLAACESSLCEGLARSTRNVREKGGRCRHTFSDPQADCEARVAPCENEADEEALWAYFDCFDDLRPCDPEMSDFFADSVVACTSLASGLSTACLESLRAP